MANTSTAVISIALVCLLFLLPHTAHCNPVCPRSEQKQQDLSTCKYGVVSGWCRNLECAKGPGERCGGQWLEHGRCGLGMYCVCGYCAGCSVQDLTCVLGRFC